MSEAAEFTSKQLSLIEATDSIYVEACPGAGKTRCIVERFMRRTEGDSRRGVALISFTNAVVKEARTRCAGHLDLVRSPNFVGTIDSFINHFIVGPILTCKENRTHTFRSVWQHVPGSLITASGVRAQAQLDWFVFTPDGDARLDPKRVPSAAAGMLRALESWKIGKLEQQAAQQWKRNIARGTLDAAASRLYLMKFVQDNAIRAYLTELMGSRFYEVVVDEVQDCSEEDVALLRLLLDAGLRLILVGDPEQAIYGFRGGSTGEFASVLDQIEHGVRLDGNFRSSAAICTAVDSLRSSAFTDRAVGKNKDIEHPVRLLRYGRSQEVQTKLNAVLAQHGTDPAHLVVLAHASTKARQCAGAGITVSTSGGNRVVGLATLVHTIHDEAVAPRARADALGGLESALHQLSAEHLAALSMECFLDHIGLSARAYRDHCLRLAMALPNPYDGKPSAFKKALADSIEAQAVMGWTVNRLRVPRNDKWTSKPSVVRDAYDHATIHSYKGLQSPAVAMIIPERSASVTGSDDGLSQWTADSQGEARNVLYVGASRAEQLLIIAAHVSVFDEVQGNLNRDGVAYAVCGGLSPD